MWSKVKQKHVSSLIGILTFIGSTIVGIVSVSTANQRGFHRLSSNILDIATNAIVSRRRQYPVHPLTRNSTARSGFEQNTLFLRARCYS